jgi:hypothetical protein
MEENRQNQRAAYTARIDQLLRARSDYPRFGGDEDFVAATGIDLSRGGMACESATPMETLTRVAIMFTLPAGAGNRKIRCEGYVAHSSYDGARCVFGICFDDLTSDEAAAIDAYIGAS